VDGGALVLLEDELVDGDALDMGVEVEEDKDSELIFLARIGKLVKFKGERVK
jgi:hypothetical protein